MNIMLVSVTECTQEIGLRKALGATQEAILTQFLIEAIILSVAGGLIGVGVGISGTTIVGLFTPFKLSVPVGAIVVGVDADRLKQMLPPAEVGMKMEPIRLCAACYAESPCHKIEWQLKVTQGCKHHQLRLLSECPNCGARFKVPALWVDGWCQRCFMPFKNIPCLQKPY